MKQIIAIMFVLTSLFSLGQNDMFWNHYSNYNPAMSAFQHKEQAALSTNLQLRNYDPGYINCYGTYNRRIKENHGLGINYSNSYFYHVNHEGSVNYNYQFRFGSAGNLSLGISAGYAQAQVRNKYQEFFDQSFEEKYLTSKVGIAYSWKKLLVGASGGLTQRINNSNSGSTPDPRLGITAQASYDFSLSRTFILTPRAIYFVNDNFHQMKFNVTGTYKSKLAIGASYLFGNTYGINASWDIKDKFRIGYMLSKTFSKLNNGSAFSGLQHEFTLGYLIKSAPMKQHPLTAPNF